MRRATSQSSTKPLEEIFVCSWDQYLVGAGYSGRRKLWKPVKSLKLDIHPSSGADTEYGEGGEPAKRGSPPSPLITEAHPLQRVGPLWVVGGGPTHLPPSTPPPCMVFVYHTLAVFFCLYWNLNVLLEN